MRSSAERRLGQVTAQLDQARQRLTAAETARVARRSLVQARSAIAGAEASLQKAGTDIQDGNYKESQERLEQSAGRILGVVLNRFDTRLHGPSFTPYSQYYGVGG